MRAFLNELRHLPALPLDDATRRFGWSVIEAAYNKGRITFEGTMVVFIQ